MLFLTGFTISDFELTQQWKKYLYRTSTWL